MLSFSSNANLVLYYKSGLQNALDCLHHVHQRMKLFYAENKSTPLSRKAEKEKQKEELALREQLEKECILGRGRGTLVGHCDFVNMLITLS